MRMNVDRNNDKTCIIKFIEREERKTKNQFKFILWLSSLFYKLKQMRQLCDCYCKWLMFVILELFENGENG